MINVASCASPGDDAYRLVAIAASIIDRQFDKTALYALIDTAFAFFGFINCTALGFANSVPVALGYLMLALICGGLARTGQIAPEEITGCLRKWADPRRSDRTGWTKIPASTRWARGSRCSASRSPPSGRSRACGLFALDEPSRAQK